jgi:hypothetical protein
MEISNRDGASFTRSFFVLAHETLSSYTTGGKASCCTLWITADNSVNGRINENYETNFSIKKKIKCNVMK